MPQISISALCDGSRVIKHNGTGGSPPPSRTRLPADQNCPTVSGAISKNRLRRSIERRTTTTYGRLVSFSRFRHFLTLIRCSNAVALITGKASRAQAAKPSRATLCANAMGPCKQPQAFRVAIGSCLRTITLVKANLILKEPHTR